MGYFIATIALSIVWGVVTNKVIENKGYDENWFWWGFFFGIFALIVAITKPECHSTEYKSIGESQLSKIAAEKEVKKKEESGYWTCRCGRLNAPYVTTCGCGTTAKERKEFLKKKEMYDNQKATQEKEIENINLLSKYKEMLDSGIISEEEFAAKKKELLKL
ncbi:MAG: SHOCT domain-containing protein [Ruminococcus sp.]|nr:SHOCT domain-containing protein [Ruminococcus sp.]